MEIKKNGKQERWKELKEDNQTKMDSKKDGKE